MLVGSFVSRDYYFRAASRSLLLLAGTLLLRFAVDLLADFYS